MPMRQEQNAAPQLPRLAPIARESSADRTAGHRAEKKTRREYSAAPATAVGKDRGGELRPPAGPAAPRKSSFTIEPGHHDRRNRG